MEETRSVTVDRRRLLQQRSNAILGMKNQFLPPELRAKAKKVVDLADVALGLMDAKERLRLAAAEAAKEDPPEGRPAASGGGA